jgi:peptide/nickel transport system permease protein
MLVFAIRRILASIPVFILSTFLVFVLVAWGADPLAQFEANNPPPSPAAINAMAGQLYLNHTIPDRYWHWLTQLFCHGTWGPSLNPGIDIGSLLVTSLELTVRLVLLAIVLAVLLAIVSGVVGAARQYSKTDYSITLVGFLFLSMPVFWFALLLKQLAVYLNTSLNWYWIATYGANTPGLTGWSAVSAGFGHLILPTLVLALSAYAPWSRFQRASMLDVLSCDYLLLAKAKGLRACCLTEHGVGVAMLWGDSRMISA